MIFLHSTNLRDLSGPGFMITTDMLEFLYQKWRQPKTIAKLQAARNKTIPSIPPTATMDGHITRQRLPVPGR